MTENKRQRSDKDLLQLGLMGGKLLFIGNAVIAEQAGLGDDLIQIPDVLAQ